MKKSKFVSLRVIFVISLIVCMIPFARGDSGKAATNNAPDKNKVLTYEATCAAEPVYKELQDFNVKTGEPILAQMKRASFIDFCIISKATDKLEIDPRAFCSEKDNTSSALDCVLALSKDRVKVAMALAAETSAISKVFSAEVKQIPSSTDASASLKKKEMTLELCDHLIKAHEQVDLANHSLAKIRPANAAETAELEKLKGMESDQFKSAVTRLDALFEKTKARLVLEKPQGDSAIETSIKSRLATMADKMIALKKRDWKIP